MDLKSLLLRSRRSSWDRGLLDLLLRWNIPFNRPHGFQVHPQGDGTIRVKVPYWRINQNHIRGIHACAMATAAEMCSGLSLLQHFDPKEYRLIMRSIHMEYHFQAKRTAFAESRIDETLIGTLRDRINAEGSTDHSSNVIVKDDKGEHLATGTIVWQLKAWSKVRTKV